MRLLLFKSNVKQHFRQLKTGKLILVREHVADHKGVGSNDKNRSIREKHVKTACDMYSSGEGIKAIANTIGVHKQTITKWLREEGVFEARQVPLPKELKGTVLQMYMDAVPIQEIINKTGVSASAIRKIAIRAGVLRTRSEATAIRAGRESVNFHRGKVGYFHSKKTGDWVSAASSYEYIRMEQLENDPAVSWWGRCKHRIQYEFNGQKKIYVPDLQVSYSDGTYVIEEIKPKNFLTDERNIAKFDAAKRFCDDHGFQFRLITEDHVGNGRKFMQDISDPEKLERKRKLGREATQRYRERKSGLTVKAEPILLVFPGRLQTAAIGLLKIELS